MNDLVGKRRQLTLSDVISALTAVALRGMTAGSSFSGHVYTPQSHHISRGSILK